MPLVDTSSNKKRDLRTGGRKEAPSLLYVYQPYEFFPLKGTIVQSVGLFFLTYLLQHQMVCGAQILDMFDDLPLNLDMRCNLYRLIFFSC